MALTLVNARGRVAIALVCALPLGCGPSNSKDSGPQSGSGGTAAGGEAAIGGSTGTAGAGMPSGGTQTQAGGGTAQQAGSGNAGSSSAGGISNTTATGTIQVGLLLGPQTGFQASARFAAKGAETGFDCQVETFGPCSVSTCTENGKTASAPPYAGDITLTDGNMVNVKLTASSGAPYVNSSLTSSTLSGGELLTVKASGGDFPPFMSEIAVPRVITISSPTLDETGLGSAPTDGDLVLTFDNRAADGETGTRLLAIGTASTGSPSLNCELPTESGTATIPAAALAKFRGIGQLLLITSRTKTLQAGGLAVSVIAYMSATNPAKSKAAIIRL